MTAWFDGLLMERTDVSGRLALASSVMAASLLVGQLLSPLFWDFFPYQLTRVLLYGSALLGGAILGTGFLSETRKARLAATTTVIAVMLSYFALRVGLTGVVMLGIRWAYTAGLLAIGGLWLASTVRRWLLK